MLRRVILVAIIKRGGKYLLTQQNEGYHKGYWGFPGGNIEETDGSLEERLSIEVSEEVGLKVIHSYYLGSCSAFVKEENLHLVWVFYNVEDEGGKLNLGSEIGAYEWLSVADLKAYDRSKIRPPLIWFDTVVELLT